MATEKKKLIFNPVSGQFDTIVDVADLAETADLAAYQELAEKGQANGYASLDGGGKVPSAQLPNNVMQYQGQYDAVTDTPVLTNGTGSAGDVYEVIVAGSSDFGAGSISFNVGDWVVYNGSIWEKSINSNEVVSVNGLTGAVTLDTDDLAEGANLYFTDERAQDAVGGILTDSSTVDFTYDDASNTITADVIDGSITNAKVASGIDAVKIANGTVDNTEFQYLNGVTSNIQTQLTGKLSLTGGTMSGAIDMGGSKITTLGTPTVGTDAVNKTYADGLLTNVANKTLSNLNATNINQELRYALSFAGVVGTANSGNSATMDVLSGNASAGTSGAVTIASGSASVNNNSGSLTLRTGTVSGTGVRGTIRLVDASLASASVGHVWTLTNTGTGAGSWQAPASTSIAPTVQIFTSGSGTYTTPANVKRIVVKMCGGAGGAGAPDSGTSAGGTGGTSTFGTSLLTAPGGSGSPGGPGGIGGTGAAVATINSPAVGRAWAGATGSPGGYLADSNGGDGGTSVLFAGAGPGGYRGFQGGTAVTNSGCGGGGGGGFTGLASSGGGGGAASLEAEIASPSATYAYAVGAAGTPGSTGGSGIAAGNSAAGIIIVTEYY